MQVKSKITSLITWIAATVVLMIAIVVPGGYFALSYQYYSGSLDAEAEINARLISQIVSSNPEMWHFEQIRLSDTLGRRPRKGFPEIRRIRAMNGDVVAESADHVDRPLVVRSVQLFDAGVAVGRIEVARSLRPLIERTLLLGLLATTVGITAFMVLRNVPIRTIRRYEDNLRRERDTAQKYLDVASVMLVALDQNRRVIMINRKGCEILGRPEEQILGRDWFEEYLPARIRESAGRNFLRFLSNDGSVGPYAESPVLAAEGKERQIAWRTIALRDPDGAFIGTLSSGEDVTEKKLLADQLRQAQKMEAIGLLAGGVAHDFNNILAAIIGYGSLAQSKMGKDDPLRHNIEQILTASDRAARLVKSLLAFSRKQVIDPRPVPVNKIVADVHKLLSRLLREDIELRVDLCPEEFIIRADAGQIEQVLMNLATNARDAMPNGGLFHIKVTGTVMDQEYIEGHGFGSEGEYVCIAVSDNGVGMTAEVQSRIFDPFFTTKEVGKGTGLGLAMAYGSVKQHKGYINVYSTPGEGTTFKIYLPVIPAAEAQRKREDAPAPKGGSETILLTEDDIAVRGMMASVLQGAGYTVIEAADGREAVEVFGRNAASISLVILDVIMPKMSGKEALDAIRRNRPDIPALFVSGYTAELLTEKMREHERHFLSKPIAPRELLLKVREILDEA